MVYDSAIIGTGAAGISAALNLKVHEKNFIWIGSKELSGKISAFPGKNCAERFWRRSKRWILLSRNGWLRRFCR